jgi:hypothetical protein
VVVPARMNIDEQGRDASHYPSRPLRLQKFSDL